jgi:HAE1 family hydrophobic/amphiphilic exporter-1
MSEQTLSPKPERDLRMAVRRPVTMAMVFLTLVVFGWKSYQELPLNLMPDISYPTLTVRTEYEGGAPEDIEKLVTRPLEETLSTVGGLVEISSTSSPGVSEIVMEFTWNISMNMAQQDVRDRLDLFDPPQEVTEKPVILRYDPTLEPVMRVAITGSDLSAIADLVERKKRETQELTLIRDSAERLMKSDLEAEVGIAQVEVKGGREEEIQVLVDPDRIKSVGLSLETVVNSLAQQNINLSGGQLKEGKTEYLVRTLNEFQSVGEIDDAIVGQSNGQMIRLADVASVFLGQQDQENIITIDGQEAVQLDIYKEGDANTVEVCDKLKVLLGFKSEPSFFTVLMDKVAEAQAKRTGQQLTEDEKRQEELKKTLQSRLPEYAQISLVSDQSRFIVAAIKEVQDAAIQGGLLALLVLYFFLRDIRATLAIGIAIPISVIATFVPMFMMDITLNIMSLGGLALGIGNLVDCSIVVLESISRCREEGDDILTAADRGTKEVAAALTSSTFTTVAVYLPIAFVQGVAGQLFRDHALVVTFSQLASLLVALYLNPMLASRTGLQLFSGKHSTWLLDGFRSGRDSGRSTLGSVIGLLPYAASASLDWLIETGKNTFTPAFALLFPGPDAPARSPLRAVRDVIGGIIALPILALMFVLGIVIKLAGALLVAVFFSFSALLLLLITSVGFVLRIVMYVPLQIFDWCFNALREAYLFLVRQALRFGIAVIILAMLLAAHAASLVPELGRALIPDLKQGEFSIRMEAPPGTRLEETNDHAHVIQEMVMAIPEVQTVACEVGVSEKSSNATRGENIATLNVLLKDPDVNIHKQDAIIDNLRKQIARTLSDEVTFSMPKLFSFKTAIELQLRGDETKTLRQVGEAALEQIRKVPGLIDSELNLKAGYPEIIIELDRDLMASKNISPDQVARRLKTEVQGDVATRFNRAGTKVDIRVRAAREQLRTLNDLRRLSITDGNPPVPLESVAHIVVEEGPSEIRRVDQQEVAIITANVEGIDLGNVAQAVLSAAETVDRPADYVFMLAGQNRELQVSGKSLQFALILAIFLVYVVMACQFESIWHPAYIMFAMPLALIGVVYVLWYLQIDISITVYIGAIVLAGIVVNNAIVLVDYINQLRERGIAKREAIIQAGAIRLRPIVMTTVTTCLGLAPLCLDTGQGSEMRAPMAITVMAGLISSTLLTLVIIPAIYDVFTGKDAV